MFELSLLNNGLPTIATLFPYTTLFRSGFGDVIASRNPAVAEGERLFGYFPMATHLCIEAADISKRSLRDAAAHRQRSEEHTSELQSRLQLVCRLLLEKKKSKL